MDPWDKRHASSSRPGVTQAWVLTVSCLMTNLQLWALVQHFLIDTRSIPDPGHVTAVTSLSQLSANSRNNSIPGLGPGDLEDVSSGVNTILHWHVMMGASRLSQMHSSRGLTSSPWSQVFRCLRGRGCRVIRACFSVCVLFVVTGEALVCSRWLMLYVNRTQPGPALSN